MDREFWRNEKGWPRDQEGYVFLARAANRIAEKLFGADKWASELAAFDAVLADPVPDIHPLPDLPPTVRSPDAIGMVTALHRIGRGRESRKRTEEAKRRLGALTSPVRQLIVERASMGSLGTAVRPIEGGSITPLPTHVWHTDDSRTSMRFSKCQMSSSTPFDMQPSGTDYIFVDESGLQLLLEAFEGRVAAGHDSAGTEAQLKPLVRHVATDSAPSRVKRHSGGARPKYDWNAIQAKAFEILDYHGGIMPLDSDLPSQAALARQLLEFCGEGAPSEPQMRRKVKDWVKEWETSRQTGF